MTRFVLMVTGIALLATAAVPAPARSRGQEENWSNLRSLSVGEEIQIVYQEEEEKYLNGRFRGFTGEGVTVQWGQVNLHDETIPRQEVIRVIASRPSARARNTLAGVGAGALIGGYLGALSRRKEDAIGILAAGIVLGAIEGAAKTPDVTVYESSRELARPQLKRRARPAVRNERNNERNDETDPSWDNLRELRIFQEIRVRDREGMVYTGRFHSVSAEGIAFSGEGGEVSIERADVSEVRIEREFAENTSGWRNISADDWVPVYTAPSREPSQFWPISPASGCNQGIGAISIPLGPIPNFPAGLCREP